MGELEQGEHFITDEEGNILRPDDPRLTKRIRTGYTKEQQEFLDANPELLVEARAWKERYNRLEGKDVDGNDIPVEEVEPEPEGPLPAWGYEGLIQNPVAVEIAKELDRQKAYIDYQRRHTGWQGPFTYETDKDVGIYGDYYESWQHYYGKICRAIGVGDGSPLDLPEPDESDPYLDSYRLQQKKIEESHKAPEGELEESSPPEGG